ncbi:MAG: hypothetical protein PHH85_12860 [Candidatus Methanoperedens sp.]|nr:hypothetical protein [Candidatus Methanoperedens sp.]
MVDFKNVLEVANDGLVLPIVIITFLLLTYMVFYLGRKDADLVRSKIFLRYSQFKNAFLLLAAFAFVLVIHVALIYTTQLYFIEASVIGDLQKFFGLVMSLIMITFVYFLFRSLK